jgi:hypothetical protein
MTPTSTVDGYCWITWSTLFSIILANGIRDLQARKLIKTQRVFTVNEKGKESSQDKSNYSNNELPGIKQEACVGKK